MMNVEDATCHDGLADLAEGPSLQPMSRWALVAWMTFGAVWAASLGAGFVWFVELARAAWRGV